MTSNQRISATLPRFEQSIWKQRLSPVQMLLMVWFAVSLVLSNVMAGRLIAMPYGLSLAGGTFVFPITYVLSDIFSEVYGYKWSRAQCYIGFVANLFAVVMFTGLNSTTPPEWFTNGEAYAVVLGNTPRVLLASFSAFLAGDLINDRVFRKMRGNKAVGEKFIPRAIVSSFIGEICDSTIFVVIAFIGAMPISALLTMIALSAVLKTAYEILFAPITLLLIKKLYKYEKEFG